MELKNYPAPYVLFGSLLAMGNRLQAAGDRFYVWEVRIKT